MLQLHAFRCHVQHEAEPHNILTLEIDIVGSFKSFNMHRIFTMSRWLNRVDIWYTRMKGYKLTQSQALGQEPTQYLSPCRPFIQHHFTVIIKSLQKIGSLHREIIFSSLLHQILRHPSWDMQSFIILSVHSLLLFYPAVYNNS